VCAPDVVKQPAISIYYGDVARLVIGVTDVPSQEAVGVADRES